MNLNAKATIILLLLSALAAEMAAQGSRIMLTQLERSKVVDTTRAGQIGLTNYLGDQRYANYVEIEVDTINYIPTATGNTQNLSQFVFDTTGALWYIDWQGRAVEFQGSSTCDTDFLQISDNSCPDALTDSIYKYRYMSVGARYVWPGAELLVNDSTSSGIAVVQGSRNARLALYDSGAPGTFLMIDHGGTTPVVYMPVGANLLFKTTAGTPQTPAGSQVNHFAINTQDSTIQAFQYPNTRTDTQTVTNFLYTDGVGKFRSRPIAYITDSLGLGNGIYGGSGSVTDGTTATLDNNATFSMGRTSGNWAIVLGDIDQNQTYLYASQNGIFLGDNSYNFFAYTDNQSVIMKSPTTQLEFSNVSNLLNLNPGAPKFLIDDDRASQSGIEYNSASYGASFTDSTLVHRRYVANMISDSISSISGTCDSCFVTGGNSFGGTATLGTNDNNPLNFETNGVVRASISSGTTTGGALTLTDVTANTSTVEDAVTIQTNSTGTAAANFGPGLLFQGESSTTDNRGMARIGALWTTATDASREAKLSIQLGDNGGALAEIANFNVSGDNAGQLSVGSANAVTLSNSAMTTATGFTVGNSSQALTLGGGSGSVTISSISSSANAIILNTTNANASIILGNNSYTATSGNVSNVRFGSSFSPTSGTGVFNYLLFNGTINQTGGANGITRGIHLNQTLTAVTDFRAIDIGVNNASAKGIYQTGSLTTNNLVGNTGIGSTTTPGTTLDVTGTTSTEHLIGQNLTPTILVNTTGAGTGASASMTNAQSSDLAGRFSVTSGTGATTGLWATVTFDDAFSVTPIVQVYNEDADAAALNHYVNVSTTSFEFFVAGGQADATTYDFNFIIIGGK